MLLRSPPPGHFYLYRKQVKVKRTKINYTDVFRHHHFDVDDEREQTFENQNGFLIGQIKPLNKLYCSVCKFNCVIRF